jgi:hypothetical protein
MTPVTLAFYICNLAFIQLFANASIIISNASIIVCSNLAASQHPLDLKDNCGGDKNVQQSYNAHLSSNLIRCPTCLSPRPSAPQYTLLCRSFQILEGTRGHAESASLRNSSSSSDSKLSLCEATRTGCLTFWATGNARMRMASKVSPSCIKKSVCCQNRFPSREPGAFESS